MSPVFNQVNDGRITCVVYRAAVLDDRRLDSTPATATAKQQPAAPIEAAIEALPPESSSPGRVSDRE